MSGANFRLFRRAGKYVLLLWFRNPKVKSFDVLVKEKDSVENKVYILNEEVLTDEYLNNHINALDAKIKEILKRVDLGKNYCYYIDAENKRFPLKSDKTYEFELKYSFKDKREDEGESFKEVLMVYPTGTSGRSEEENNEKNVHLMGWCEEQNRWMKVDGVVGEDGKFRLLVKIT